MIVLLVTLALVADAMQDVLILGGTGLRGRPFTDSLLGEFNLTLVQRGTPLWDISENLLNTSRDDVLSGFCDRLRPLSHCDVIQKRSKSKWDVCVDFWPANETQMDMTLEVLNMKCKHYIYVSSYLVYTASGEAAKDPLGYTEEEARFPDVNKLATDKVEKLEKENIKGRNYLMAETYVKENAEMPWTIVRPAEVFGPKEIEIRFWILSVWAKAQDEIKLPFPWIKADFKSKFSLLSSIELAHALQLLLKKILGGECCAKDVRGEVFNLAHEEAITQQEFHTTLMNSHKKLGVLQIPVEQRTSVYPYEAKFVTVNSRKAEKRLRWSPRSAMHSILDTVNFYEKVMYSYRYGVQRVFFMSMVSVMGEDLGKKLETWADKHYQIDMINAKNDPKAIEFNDEDDDEEDDDGELRARKFTKSKNICQKCVDESMQASRTESSKEDDSESSTKKKGKKSTKTESSKDAIPSTDSESLTKKAEKAPTDGESSTKKAKEAPTDSESSTKETKEAPTDSESSTKKKGKKAAKTDSESSTKKKAKKSTKTDSESSTKKKGKKAAKTDSESSTKKKGKKAAKTDSESSTKKKAKKAAKTDSESSTKEKDAKRSEL